MTMFDAEGGFDFNALLTQAQALQQQMQDAQANLAEQRVTGSAGGGLVKVTMSGAQEVVAVEIDPSACDPSDVETLQDLVLAALRDAATQSQQLAKAALPQVPGMSF